MTDLLGLSSVFGRRRTFMFLQNERSNNKLYLLQYTNFLGEDIV